MQIIIPRNCILAVNNDISFVSKIIAYQMTDSMSPRYTSMKHYRVLSNLFCNQCVAKSDPSKGESLAGVRTQSACEML